MNHEEPSLALSLADLAELGQLFDEHRPRLLALLRRRIDPALTARIDAEDLLNDTFILAGRRWARFKREGKMQPFPWLCRLALDCLIEAWRKQTRAGRDGVMPLPEGSSIQLGLGIVNPGTSPSSDAARRELQEQMRQTLAMLKEADREILWLRHYDEMSFVEAGDVLGITENAATVRYVRALRRLKELWQQLHPE